MLFNLIDLADPAESNISPFTAATGVTKKYQEIFHNIPSKAPVMGILMQTVLNLSRI